MQQEFTSNHHSDDEGMPTGGESRATGVIIDWQNGPLGAPGDPERAEPNGAFVETVIAIAKDRLDYYQSTKFASDYNAEAIERLDQALSVLHARTADREARGVEGTHSL